MVNTMEHNKHKVLIDLLPATCGFSGIPQESRLLFKTLSTFHQEILPAGVLYSKTRQALRHNLSSEKKERSQTIISCANFLHELVSSDDLSLQRKVGILTKLGNLYRKINNKFLLARHFSFVLKELDTEWFFPFLWRNLFQRTLTIEDFDLLRKQRYFISSLNTESMDFGSSYNLNIKLNTDEWDFVVFQMQRYINLSPKTTKIIRYHDSIPLQDMDVAVPGSVIAHSRDFKPQLINNSFYVCNSEPTREELLKITPELEKNSIAIPPIIANYKKELLNHPLLLSIIKRYISRKLLKKEWGDVSAQLEKITNLRYILAISTLEPRKNYLTLIYAWEQLCAQYQSDLRLVIVGNLGWNYTEILRAMEPHIKNGRIIHLERVLPRDMGYLYSHADAFVFPSFNEGFGSPPLEAMQCECPVIASDIKTHRWVLGDAALYCDPYDANSLTQKLELLLFSAEATSLRKQLALKGLEQIKRYTADCVGQQWLSLFDNLKARRKDNFIQR